MPHRNDDVDNYRRCRDCGEWKSLEDFQLAPRRPSGRGSYCKPCFNARTRASHTKRALANGHVVKPREKPCHNVRGRESKIRNFGGTREYHLRRRYGIGVADFETILAEQGGVCAICGAAGPEHVDHDHRSGQVRGILCFNCNGGLGQFRDSELFLSQAITYLRDTSYHPILIEPGVWRVLPRKRRPLSSLSN